LRTRTASAATLRARDLSLDASTATRGAPDAQPASQRLHTFGQSAKARTTVRVSPADAVVDDLDHEAPVRVSHLDETQEAGVGALPLCNTPPTPARMDV
jgi:hypothetical protein